MQEQPSERRPVFTVDELAKLWGVHSSTIRAAIADGSVPSFRCGRRILIPRAAIEKMQAQA